MNSMSNAAMRMQSPHRDVLDANPDTDDSKARLVEELQSRGRAAVGAQSWMDAKLLYEKALTVASNDKLAILNSNLSLVHKSMGSFAEAQTCAQAATEADPTYVKGWWRLGQALQNLQQCQDALTALSKAKELDPNNKALVKEYEKVQKKAKEEAKLMKEAAEAAEAAAAMSTDEDETAATTKTTTKKNTTATTTTTTSKTTTTATTTANDTKMQVDEDEQKGLFSKSDAVRGYKVVNGKKTSYFHNELDEKTKELIGDIAPKKLEPSSVANDNNNNNADNKNKGGSAWNKAGTWEEKNVSKWAKKSLEEQLLQTVFVLPDSSPAPGALVTVTSVKTLDGHASFALARGKKRYIYEYLAKLEWKLQQRGGGTAAAASEDDNNETLKCTGSLAIPDIDGTIDLGEGYEIHDFKIDSVSDNSAKPLIDRFVHRGGFHDALNESIDDWVRLFKREY